MAMALRKCPELVIAEPDYELYVSASRSLMALLREYSPLVEQFSIDEAWMDMTGTAGLFGPPVLAAEQLKDGVALDAIEETIRAQVPSMCQSFTVDDLKYLKKTGRVSGAAAIIGNVLSIHPILIGDYEGKIVVKSKVRGMKRTLDALAERYAELALSKTETIGIAHADNEDGKAYLVQRLRDKGLTGKCLSVCYEPVTGSHVGPGTVALFFFGTDRMG